jgi:hypothetical protein
MLDKCSFSYFIVSNFLAQKETGKINEAEVFCNKTVTYLCALSLLKHLSASKFVAVLYELHLL